MLVVFGHVIFGIQNMGGISQPQFAPYLKDFIWTYHVPLFMFLSGFVYRITGEWKSKKTRWQFIVYKLVNLGVPYIVFSVLYVLINSKISDTNTSYSMQDLLYLWKTPVAQYWFLRTLFILFVIYALCSRFLSNIWITIILTVLSCVHLLFPEIHIPLGNVFNWAFAFGFGACLASLDKFCFSGFRAAAVIMGHLALEAVCLLTGISGLPVIVEIERAAGIIASITLVTLLVRNAGIRKFLLYISRYSFPIYLLHTFFTAGARILLQKAGIHSYTLHVTIGTLLGIVLPLLIAIIMEKTGWMNIVLYPSHTLKKLKQKHAKAR